MSSHRRSLKRRWWFKHFKAIALSIISLGLIIVGLVAIWVSTLQIPDLSSFETRKVDQSTKIYDRTGQILLYDVHGDSNRTIVPFEDIAQDIKNATISIEDQNFYKNIGIEPLSIIRAVLADITGGQLAQGGSTITQQVIKNSVLTTDKTVTRKLKEWILAIKLNRVLTKDQILATYLNETPYGGNIYGVEEASQTFFGKAAKDDDLAEAAYIAAIPQAPTYYSPYGPNKAALDARQKLVLSKMKAYGYITDDQYQAALKEQVTFLEKNTTGIRAPHFAIYVKNYLVQKYGEDMVDNGGLKVTTTLNYDDQQAAEKVIANFAPTLASQFDASNTAMVAIDPKTGDILSMVGSNDYFDTAHDGNFNVATALRQPGSTFKPFVYATAFMKGYTPETEVYDVKTQFSPQCDPVTNLPRNPASDPKICYSPDEYDGLFEGPMTMKMALAQSRNVPAVETLYMAGIKDSIATAQAMGITSLTNPDNYGLPLVLGGAEVSLLELTSAYGVFANDGIRNPYRSILEVDDANGNVLEKAQSNPTQSIPPQIARQITDMLSDPTVRLSYLNPLVDVLGGKQVAMKTGTTNDYRDVWVEGYTPSIVAGFWAGKNDDTPMDKKVAGLVIAPVWSAFLAEINNTIPTEYFKKPDPTPDDLKPVLRGIWKGGVSYKIDTISKKLATQYTPPELTQEIVFNSVHNILNWVDKDNPQGPIPTDPQSDPQYANWEYSVRQWFTNWLTTNPGFTETGTGPIPTATDDVHVPANFPIVSIASPQAGTSVSPTTKVSVVVNVSGKYPENKVELYINDKYISTNSTANQTQVTLSFVSQDVGLSAGDNIIKVIAYDSVLNRSDASTDINVTSQ